VTVEEEVVGEHVADDGAAKDVRQSFAQFLRGGVVENGGAECSHRVLLLVVTYDRNVRSDEAPAHRENLAFARRPSR
jgi:hypothetical protein